MNRGPVKAMQRVDFVSKAIAAWGTPPDWILSLAQACDQSSQTAIAKRLAYSAPTISQVLSNTYPGDIVRIEMMVRGALMKAVVDCPVLGEIGRNRCLEEQDEPFRSTSAMRAQLYHACRGGCPFSKHTKGSDHGSDA